MDSLKLKAKEVLINLKNYDFDALGNYKMDEREARKLIRVLEKYEVPQKPKQSGVEVDGVFYPTNGIDGVPYDLCPTCETNLCTTGILGRSKKTMHHCENCGQALDWEVKNENTSN